MTNISIWCPKIFADVDFSDCFKSKYIAVFIPALSICGSVAYFLIYIIYRIRERRRISLKDLNKKDTSSNLSEFAQLLVTSNRNTRILYEIITIAIQLICLAKLEIFLKYSGYQPTGLKLFWAFALVLCAIRVIFYNIDLSTATRVMRISAIFYTVGWFLQLITTRSIILLSNYVDQNLILLVSFLSTTFLLVLLYGTIPSESATVILYHSHLKAPLDAGISWSSTIFYDYLYSFLMRNMKYDLTLLDIPDILPKLQAYFVLSRFESMKRHISFTRRLFKMQSKHLAAQFTLASLEEICFVLPYISLTKILQFVGNPEDSARTAAWTYVVLYFLGLFLRSVFGNTSLKIGRQISVQVRATIIGEIYSKALRKRATAKSKTHNDNDENSEENEIAAESASQGNIVNLMSVDAFQVAELSAYLHLFVSQIFLAVIIFTAMLYRLLGWSGLVALAIIVFATPFNIFSCRKFSEYEKRLLHFSDRRSTLMNEVLDSIRVIKSFAWESFFEEKITDIRNTELQYLKKRFIIWGLLSCVWNIIPYIMTSGVFYCYVFIAKEELTTSVAFTALALIQALRGPFDVFADIATRILEARVSLNRVETFMQETETYKIKLMQTEKRPEDPVLGFHNASFSWLPESEIKSTSFLLKNITIDFPVGKYTVIIGPTGAGKSSILHALLGEMDCLEGKVYIPHYAFDPEKDWEDDNRLLDSIAFCSQQPWLINATIRDNILFGLKYNRKRYEQVIHACALEKDFEILTHRDLSRVGDRGLNLSGGQKQRISLARALYSKARHVLMDDCLSAVDTHSAHWIFTKGLIGDLMTGRTRILVSHNVNLAIPKANFAVVMNKGAIIAQGTPSELANLGYVSAFNEILEASELNSELEENEPELHEGEDLKIELAEDIPGKFTEAEEEQAGDEEEIATGAVTWNVYKRFLKALGGYNFWLAIVFITICEKGVDIISSLWVRKWASRFDLLRPQYFVFAEMLSIVANNPDNSNKYFFVIYVLLAFLLALILMIRSIVSFSGSLKASRSLHLKLMKSVMHAKTRFFDVTPTGRIMNRFSKDIVSLDRDIILEGMFFIICLNNVLAVQFILFTITPLYFVGSIFIGALLFFIGRLYLNSARQLRRFESVNRSPIIQHFSESLDGLVTIRAYGHENRFISKSCNLVDNFNRPFYYTWMSNRWLTFRLDILGGLVNVIAGSFAVYYAGTIDAGLIGIILSYSLTLSSEMLWLVRFYTSTEINLNSVERICHYIDIEGEDQSPTKVYLDPNWPHEGQINIEGLKIRYDESLPEVIRNLNVSIPPGAKVGIVGRTGAGKSSLASSILRLVEPSGGRIVIDGVNTQDVSLKELRQAISYIPQDPILFGDTLRFNLDPSGLYTDLQLYRSLLTVCLISEEEFNILAQNENILHSKNVFVDLSYNLTPGGKNLSQGQRQLVCLARSFLKKSKVIIMDESTASVDFDIQGRIQDSVLTQYGDATVITIAHRLATIISYDYILVMSRGEMIEFASPRSLLSDENSAFSQLCRASGEYEQFVELIN